MSSYFRLLDVARQFLDSNGDPLAGGKLLTYVGGATGTNKTTYQDSGGVTPHANPIVLDSAGRVPYEVWGATGTYNLKLTTTADVEVWTRANIDGVNDSAATAGGEWIASGLTPTYIGATSFSLLDDQTTVFHVGRRLKILDSGVVYATIKTSAYTSLTTVAVITDSGTIDSGLVSVSYGINSAVNSSITRFPDTDTNSNIAIGYGALDANTANYNVAVGANALTANTTGAQNVGVGQSALAANTTASANVAVGMSALGSNTTGTQNVAAGVSALAANTTANYNVAFGTSALGSNTTGAQNVAVGQSALAANTTASNNVAVGQSALTVNTGAQNVAVGQSALAANTTANYNVAFGTNALLDVTTGILNVGVGHQSGSGALAAGRLTTGTGNIFIGYRACGTVAAQNYGTALGYDVEGAAGYTTVGQSTSDIRAAHGVATWAVVSDQRYKKDIADSTAGLDFVNALRPRTFKYRTLGELPETFRAYAAGSTEVFKNSNTNHGFIAQEVKAAIDADSSIKDGFRLWDDREDGSQEVAEAALIPVLVKAIQELSAQVNSLTTRLEALEGR
jgi:hypothetical protein